MTSTHIRNLVSSWDTKVEEAKEVVSEAEKIRLFLEERSTAHAELPKSKVPVTASELLAPLPSLPPPPKTPPLGGGHARRRDSYSVDLGASSSGHKKRSQSARPAFGETRSASATHMSLVTKTKGEEAVTGYGSGPEAGKSPKSAGSSRSSSPKLTPIEEKKTGSERPNKVVSVSDFFC